jgi:acyl-[acyl-carrier-protein]-phospholipid O-acyltransferase / long-chain-fatty-acid--[acyl-carrier-protein] ligase
MNLLSRIIAVAEKFPDRTAVIDSATGKTYTYSRLLTASFLFADILKKKDEEFIGVMMPVTAGACITFIAVLITGKVPVMINYSTGAENNIRMARKKCRFKTIVTSKKLCDKLSIPHSDGMIYAEEIAASVGLFSKINALIKSTFPNFFSETKNSSDIAVLLFTTGSEKDPKAVMLTHDNILANVESLCKVFIFDENDVFAGVLPLFHIYGLTTSFFLPLLSGSAINTFPNPLEYQAVSDGIKKNKCTIITATPTFLRGYCQKSAPGDFKTLRIIMAGGDKLTKHIKDMFQEKHGLLVLEGYGTTETSPVVSVNTFENNKFGSIGKPLPDVQVRIVDIDTEQILPALQEGKIYVKGRLVMKGYYDQIEETSLRIRNGWYDTGDIGMIDEDGYLWHKGRLRRFVKIGGEMVSLTAVEIAVGKYIGEDSQCCAIEVPHISRGADIIVAVTAKIDENDLRKKVSQELPPIALPKKFVFFSELPLMGNGKVNFRAVEEMCRESSGI